MLISLDPLTTLCCVVIICFVLAVVHCSAYAQCQLVSLMLDLDMILSPFLVCKCLPDCDTPLTSAFMASGILGICVGVVHTTVSQVVCKLYASQLTQDFR